MEAEPQIIPLKINLTEGLGHEHCSFITIFRLSNPRVTSAMHHLVIINADDFGMSSRVNRAVIESFEKRLISSATIMANMPGFEEACDIANAHKINSEIGIHLNLTEGHPLTDPIRRCQRICGKDGQFSSRFYTIWRITPEEANAIRVELSAQVDAALKRGITPTHFDSHMHFHTQWPVATIVMQLAYAYRVPAIRLTRNCGSRLGGPKRVYKMAFNARLARNGFARTRYFGSALEVASLSRLSGPIEIMVHPDLDTEGRIIDITSGVELLEDVVARWTTSCILSNYRGLPTEFSPI